MTPETADLVCSKARAAFLRTDGVEVADAELVDFAGYVKVDPRYKGGSYTDPRYAGKYVLLRQAGQVVAVYKMLITPGPAHAVRRDGDIAFEVNSLSVGVKRIKRAPKGLLPVTD